MSAFYKQQKSVGENFHRHFTFSSNMSMEISVDSLHLAIIFSFNVFYHEVVIFGKTIPF